MRYYDPYGKDKELREPTESQTTKWITTGFMAAGGIALSYKIRGPMGKMVHDLEQNKAMREAQRKFVSHSRPEKLNQLYSKIPTGMKTRTGKNIVFDPHMAPTQEQVEFASDLINEKIGMRGTGKEAAERVEAEINALMSGKKTIKGINIIEESISTGISNEEISSKILLAKLRREMLMDHIGSDAKYMESAPDYDIFTGDGPGGEYTNYKQIEEVHAYYLENDPVYSAKYYKRIAKYKTNLESSIKSQVASNPNVGQYSPEMDDRVVPKIFGGHKDLRAEFPQISINANHSAMLYSGNSKSMITAEALDKTVNTIVSAKSKIRTTDLQQYGPAVKKLVVALEKLRVLHPDTIAETSVEELGFNKAFGDAASYLNVLIKRKMPGGQDYVIELPIPIKQDNMIPSLNINARPFINADMASDFISNKPAADTTEQIIHMLTSRLNGVMAHEICESPNPKAAEDKFRYMIQNHLSGLSPISYEMRDYFQTQGIRIGIVEQLQNSHSSDTTKQRLRAGVKNLRMMRQIKKNEHKYNILVLDLETINLSLSSPGKTPLSPLTDIWQAGFTFTNGAGEIISIDQVTSNHILSSIPELRPNVTAADLRNKMSGSMENSKALREYGTFAKRALSKVDPRNVPIDEAEALIRFRDYVMAQSNSPKNLKVKANTKDQFVQQLGNYVKAAEKKSVAERKKLVLLDANGTFFDRALLNNLASSYGWLTKDSVDIQSINYALTLGHYDADSRSLSNLLQQAMESSGRSTALDIIDFENMSRETIDKIVSGPNSVVRMHGMHKGKLVSDYLKEKLDSNTLQAHGAGLDTVATLALFQLNKQDRNFLDVNKTNKLGQLLEDLNFMGVKESFERNFAIEGWTIPGSNNLRFSSSMMSSGQSFKGHGSYLHLGSIMPLYIENPLTKAPQQVYRNIWIKKNSVVNPQDRDYRFRNPLQTPMVLEAEKWMHRRASWLGNQLAHQVQFNTIYTLGSPGGKTSGELIVTRDAMDFSSFDVKTVPFHELEQQMSESPLANKLLQFKNEVSELAKKKAQQMHVNRRHQGGESTSDIWWAASQEIRDKWERNNIDLPTIDPNTKISTFLNEGGKMREVKSALGGEVFGFVLETEVRRENNNGPIKLLAAMRSVTDVNNGLDKIAFNHHMTKSIVTLTDTISAKQAWGPAAKLGPIQVQMNFDFLDKGYWGSMKTAMLNKAVSLAYHRTKKTSGFSAEERARAHGNLKKITSKLNSIFPASLDGEGVIRWGPSVDNQEGMASVLKKMANQLPITDILDMLQTVGHEAVWDTQTLEAWYGNHGGFKEARTNLKAKMIGMRSQLDKITKDADNIGMIESMNRLIDHYDPLTIVEQNLRKRNALKGGSIDKHWQLINDAEKRNELLGEVPIFMQMVPTTTGLREGMWAFSQSFTPYGLEGNKAEVNKRVKFQTSYFKQFIFGNHITDTTKKTLLASGNWRNDPRSNAVLKRFSKLYDAATNKNISELYTKHALSVEDVRALTDRRETISAIDKHLSMIQNGKGIDGITREDLTITQGFNQIGAFADELLDSSYDKDRALGKMRNPSEVLNSLKNDRYNWAHIDEIQNTWLRLAKQKGGAFYIPLRNIKSGGEKIPLPDKPFTMVLEDVMESITSAPGRNKPHINKDRFIQALLNQSRANKGHVKGEKLFDVEFIQSHQDKSLIGKHVITLNGLYLPTGETTHDFFNRQAGGYGVLNDVANTMKYIGFAYNDYLTEAIESRKLGIEGTLGKHESAISQHWLKMMMYTYMYDKNNPAFNASQYSFPGYQPLYMPIDNALERAHGILSNMSDSGNEALVKKYGKTKLGGILNNLVTSKVNTVFLTTDTWDQLKEGGQRAIKVGMHGMLNEIPLATMIANADDQVREAVRLAEAGEHPLPGGIFSRNPMGPNGVYAAMNTNLNLVPSDIGNALGLKSEVIYAPAVFGSLIKADSDRDHAVFAMLGFSTIEEMNNLRTEGQTALTNFMDMEQSKRVFNEFNNSMFHTGMTPNPNTGELETQLVSVVTNKSDSEYGSLRFGNPISSKQARKMGAIGMSNLTNEKMLRQMLLGASPERAIEQHISTAALVASSKRVIPLITNTVRTRISDIYRGGSVKGKTSTAIELLIGDIGTGLSALGQESITLGKHGANIESAYDILSLHQALQDPGKMAIEQWDDLKSRFRKAWDTDAQAQLAEEALTNAMGMSASVKHLSRVDKSLEQYLGLERAYEFGSSLSAAEWSDIVNFKNGGKNRNLNPTASMVYRAMKSGDMFDMNKVSNPNKAAAMLQSAIETNFDLARASMRAPSVMGAWFGPEKAIKAKGKIAKFGSIAALGYLALNFFRPNQLSNSMNPADGFINLGTDSGGDNNFWSSDTELARGVPIDTVNASWEQTARIDPSSDFQDYKHRQSIVYNALLNNKLFNTFGLQLQSNSQANISYTNYTTKTGSFNSYDISRRMRKNGNNRG